jgi:tRNA(Arg) A34 adenosine deaminase TadA
VDPEKYMREAIAMAERSPAAPFGAVIVRRDAGDILARGFNRAGESPLLHGEIDAINRCHARYPDIDWRALDLYSTAEPCPMCQGAIEWAGFGAVFFGSSIPFLALLGWPQIKVRAEEISRKNTRGGSSIIGGILERECDELFRRAIAMRQGARSG